MSKKFKLQKLVCPLLAFLLILTPASPAFAEKADNSEQTTEAAQADTTALPRNPSVSGWPSAPEIADETGVLLEASTGQVLFDKDMNEIRYPASTTKAMTALLILENISNINKKITFTDIILPDLAPGNSTINAQVGEELTVEQCLYAIMLASANEVCTQMAVEVAGSVSAFTDMMNQRAAELGCKNTHFVNANGLPDPNHYTTAYDLALILSEAIKNENFCKIAGAAKYTIPAGTYSGQDQDVLTSAIKITLCTSADVPEDVIYDLTKTFWENIDTLSQSQSILKSCSVEEAVTDLAGLPIHDGAAKYYKEIGVLE